MPDKTARDIHKRFQVAYDAAFQSGETPNERVIWPSKVKQHYRFAEMCSFMGDLSRPDLSILDLGCGNGELVAYLNEHGFSGDYLGIDMHAGLIQEARERFPGYAFQVGDLLDLDMEPRSFVAMSGVINVQADQTLDYVESLLAKAFSFASDALLMNAISTLVEFREPDTYYLDPADAITIAAKLTPTFQVKHGWPPYNFTLYLARRKQWCSID